MAENREGSGVPWEERSREGDGDRGWRRRLGPSRRRSRAGAVGYFPPLAVGPLVKEREGEAKGAQMS